MEKKRFGIIKKELIERLTQMPKVEQEKLLDRIRYKLNIQQSRILEEAFSRNLFTKGDYETNYKDMFYVKNHHLRSLRSLDGGMNFARP